MQFRYLRKLSRFRIEWKTSAIGLAVNVNLLDYRIITIKENTETLLETRRDVGLEIDAEKLKYVAMSRHSKPRPNQNIRIANDSYGKCGKVQILGDNI
jgi:hypothetical protein